MLMRCRRHIESYTFKFYIIFPKLFERNIRCSNGGKNIYFFFVSCSATIICVWKIFPRVWLTRVLLFSSIWNKKAERKVEKMGTSFIQYRRSVMLGYSFSTHLLCSPFKWWKTNQVWQVVMVFNASFDSRLFFHISMDQSALFREIENWMNYIIVCVKGYFYGQ